MDLYPYPTDEHASLILSNEHILSDPLLGRYAVRAPTSHPVLESFRIRTFRQLLSSLRPTPVDEQLEALGELMFFTHQSYSDCGLGSPGTDRCE